MTQRRLADRALGVLQRNDTGLYFKPGPRVYPFQWNWDSALVALGLSHVDPERGRIEVRSLLRGQWADGMVPHIVFHRPAPEYSPGPELWGSQAYREAPPVPTSGITQPPVLASAVRALEEAAPDTAFLADVLPALEAWHAWLHRERSVDGGLVAIVHPWESADNSPRFDRALARIEVERARAPERSDRRHAAAEERPTDADYLRYAAIVDHLRASGYRPELAEAPFAYVDLSFNSVLAVAEDDLAWLWQRAGGDAERAEGAAVELREALRDRWDDDAAAFRGGDVGARWVSETADDLFPLYAGAADAEQARRLYDETLWAPDRFGPSAAAPWAVTSTSKASEAYERRRYWRGPVWVNINWFLVRGLERAGLGAEAEALRAMTLELVERSGFAEYYDPETGEPLGSADFSWSAALTLDLLERR